MSQRKQDQQSYQESAKSQNASAASSTFDDGDDAFDDEGPQINCPKCSTMISASIFSTHRCTGSPQPAPVAEDDGAAEASAAASSSDSPQQQSTVGKKRKRDSEGSVASDTTDNEAEEEIDDGDEGEADEDTTTCENCGRSFDTARGLISHKRSCDKKMKKEQQKRRRISAEQEKADWLLDELPHLPLEIQQEIISQNPQLRRLKKHLPKNVVEDIIEGNNPFELEHSVQEAIGLLNAMSPLSSDGASSSSSSDNRDRFEQLSQLFVEKRDVFDRLPVNLIREICLDAGEAEDAFEKLQQSLANDASAAFDRAGSANAAGQEPEGNVVVEDSDEEEMDDAAELPSAAASASSASAASQTLATQSQPRINRVLDLNYCSDDDDSDSDSDSDDED